LLVVKLNRIAQSQRKKFQTEHQVGPGQYRTRRKIGGSRYSFGASMTKRFKEIDEDEIIPGPAHYAYKSYTSTAPKYLFKFKQSIEDVVQF